MPGQTAAVRRLKKITKITTRKSPVLKKTGLLIEKEGNLLKNTEVYKPFFVKKKDGGQENGC
ncbi:MAG: hypothetical protein Kow0037_27310 [Calditrichia bacterium]